MKKIRFLALLLAVLMIASVFAGCAKSEPAKTEDPQTSETADSAKADTTEAPTEEQPASTEKKDINFYAKIVEYAGGPEACEKMQELLADKYNIECLQVDWGNLATVIRTGIASGEPCDVYEYWTQNMQSFADEGMALDLTDYLEADDGAWKKTLSAAGLESACINGRYYAVPITSNFTLMLANKTLLDENGIEIPENWTWDVFMDFCKKAQDAGLFAVGMGTDNRTSDWFIRNGLLSASVSAGKYEDMYSGKVATDDPIFTEVLTNVKDMYDAKYVYPGDGAVTVSADETKAAFYQQKVALYACTSSQAAANAAEADFEVVVLPWPSMGDTNAVLGGCDAVFIPSNVADPEAAVEVIKTYTSAEVQSVLAEGGIPVANVDVKASNPVTQKAIDISNSVYPFEFVALNDELFEYSYSSSLADLVLNGGVETVLANYAALMNN